MKVTALARPFILICHESGAALLLTSEQAQQLLNVSPIVRATKFRVTFKGTTLRPATVGGGVAFEVTK